MTDKKYDKHMLGRSPAAIYLADTLNQTPLKKDHNVLRSLTKFRHIFNQLVKAYDQGLLDSTVIRSFSAYKRADLLNEVDAMIKEGYTPLVAKLYCNLVIADLKKFERTISNIARIEKSAVARAKSHLKNKHLDYKNQAVATYGRSSSKDTHVTDVIVQFNQYGQPAVETSLSRQDVPDTINDETLAEKSRARLVRLGKISSDNEFVSTINPFSI